MGALFRGGLHQREGSFDASSGPVRGVSGNAQGVQAPGPSCRSYWRSASRHPFVARVRGVVMGVE